MFFAKKWEDLSIFAVKTKLMFFLPRIGQHYQEGFKGYRTLVLGVKHHCTHKRCPHYDDCVTRRNCASYNEVCPVYGDRHDLRLSQSNQIEIDAFLEVHDRYPTYSYFTKLMLGKTDDCTEVEKTAFWEQVAFANYLQYFCPSPQVPEYKEDGLAYRAEDWMAFQELLEGLLARNYICWQGKRLKAVRGKAGQLLHRGLYEAGLSWPQLEGLFADDNMAKNANRKKIAKLLENPSAAAARYYRELFGL